MNCLSLVCQGSGFCEGSEFWEGFHFVKAFIGMTGEAIDGSVFCDRLLFILWSKSWRNIFDPSEEKSVLICPDMKKGIIEKVVKLLMTGNSNGLEKDFEIFFETVLDIFDDLPEGFSNFQTSDETFEKRAKKLIARRNTFKGLRLNGHVCEYCLFLSTF